MTGPPGAAGRRDGSTAEIHLSVGGLVGWLAAIICILGMIGVAMPVLAYLTGHDVARATFHLLNVRHEGSIPTLFSSSLLAMASILLFVVSAMEKRHGGRDVAYWRGLGFAFAYLAVDETAQLHETLNHFSLGGTGFLAVFDRFPWVWFYTPLAALFAIAYGRFLLRLPRRTALIFILSGALFVGGAIGVEEVGAYQVVADHISRDSLAYVLRGVSKEMLMYGGVTLFIWCLLHRIRNYGEPLHLAFGAGTAAGRVGP